MGEFEQTRQYVNSNTAEAVNMNPYLGGELPKPMETPKQLRKRAARIEKQRKAVRKRLKVEKRELKRRQADREKVRKGLLKVIDSDKGYGKAEAARALQELGMI